MLDTFGWDIVYATTLRATNAGLQASGKIPAAFAGGGLSGAWGSWAFVPGAPSNYLVLACTVASGTAEIDGKSYDLTGSLVCVQVSLEIAPDGTVTPRGGDAIVLDRYKFPSGIVGQDVFTVAAAFHAILKEQVPGLAGALGGIDLGGAAADPGSAWIVPTSAALAITPLPLGDAREAIVAILATSEGRPAGDLQVAVDGRLLDGAPEGCDRAVAYGPRLVVESLLMPAMTSLVQGSTPSDFGTSATGTIYNAGTMTWGGFAYDDGKGHAATISPTIPAGNLQLTLNGADAHVSMSNVHFPYPGWGGPGEITVSMNVEQFVQMGIVRRSDGRLVIAETGDPVQSYHVTVIPDAAVLEFQLAVDVVLQVLFAIIGGVLESAAGAAETAVSDSIEEGAEGSLVSQMTDEEIDGLVEGNATEEDIERAEEESGEQAGAAIENADNPGWIQKFKSVIMENRQKIILKIIEKAVEIPAGQIVTIAVALAKHDYDELPPIDPLATQTEVPVTWADGGATTFAGGTIDGAIVFWGAPASAPPQLGARAS